MTEFEKKLKIRHEKRMKYKADPEKLRMRLERDKMLMDKEYDMAATYGVDMEPWNNIPRKPRKLHFWRRIIAFIIVVLLVFLFTIIARVYFLSGPYPGWPNPEGLRSVETILWRGKDGFEYNLCRCDGEKYIIITGIGDYVGETDITIPGTIAGYKVKAIGEGAFKNNTDLVTVKIEEGVEEIREEAFYGCSSIKTVHFPGTLNRMDKTSFEGTKIQVVHYNGSKEKYSYLFSYCGFKELSKDCIIVCNDGEFQP